MKGVEIKPDIFWVGVIDWAIRDFHGYVTPGGTTYNNYLIVDDEVTLVDTVKHDFFENTYKNIAGIIDPTRISNIVINHVETDHVSSLDRFMAIVPKARIYISAKGKEVIESFFDTSGWDIRVVKTDDEVKLGKYTLQFIETPMIHWPDSIMTYVREARLLISQDAFGQHLASSVRFDDDFVNCASHAHLEDAVIDYYANILMPFGSLIKSKIKKIREMGIPIDMIAPDHGVIWRGEPEGIMEHYMEMASGKADLSVAIIYDTMWNSTEIMANYIMRGIKDEGIYCKVIKLRATPTSAAITEFWKSRACLVGSPTLNNEVFPSVAELMSHLKGLRPKDRIMGAFGSYGWSGGAVKWLYDEFGQMKLEKAGEGIAVKYRPSPEEMQQCYEFGREFAGQVKEFHKKYE